MADKIQVKDLSVFYRQSQALKNVSLSVHDHEVLAITGPTASGKTTLLRTLNRLNDLVYYARHTGQVVIDGQDIYRDGIDIYRLRKKVGMVFALPISLPLSIYDNVAFGPRLAGIRHKKRLDEIVEKSLRDGILWDEVKDRLGDLATKLSGGQQQRLCIARILAVEPDIIMLDEPSSGLDPISTLKIENLLRVLVSRYTIIFVTHNTKQAARVSDRTAFMLSGELVEVAPTAEFFTNPKDKRTEDFITGRFG